MTTRGARRLSILAAALSWACLGAAEPAPPARLEGLITEGAVDAAIAGLAGQRRLNVTSGGGSVDAARRLGAYIRAHRVATTFSGDCLSACTLYLLGASHGADAAVTPGTFLGWHHTDSALYYALVRRAPRQAEQYYGALARAEQVFYRRAGLDRRLLVLPFLALNVQCVDRAPVWGRQSYRAQYAWATFERPFLRRAGLDFQGEPADRPETIARAVAAHLRDPKAAVTVAPREIETLTWDEAVRRLGEIPLCRPAPFYGLLDPEAPPGPAEMTPR